MISLAILLFHLSTFSSGNVIRHRFTISHFAGAPDGVATTRILGINGQFPGPTIQATVGDTIEVTVMNNIEDGQNTTLHWHGITQRGTIFEDGPSQIIQCPIPPGGSQVYRFTVPDAGTFWYHSHVRSQYTEGLFGPLIVEPHWPVHAYIDEFMITLSDWYHQTAEENEEYYFTPGIHSAPYPDSGLMNGHGRYPCNVAQSKGRSCDPNKQLRHMFKVTVGFIYRIRIANAAAFASFKFSIDGHHMKVIEVDGISVDKPPLVDYISIAPGQRYSVLIVPKRLGQFLIRATIRKEHMRLIPGNNINKYPESLIGELTAVLKVGAAGNDPMVMTSMHVFPHDRNVTKPDKLPHQLVPLDVMMLAPLGGAIAPEATKEFTVNTGVVVGHDGIARTALNGVSFTLPHNKPILMTYLEEGRLPTNATVFEIDYGDVVQLILNNHQGEPHPFHLHGHHFWVTGLGEQGAGDYQQGNKLTRNGPKRDTVVVQKNSWMAIRFVADNPGIWVFHCHVDWHNLGGMALVFVEAGDKLRQELKVSDEARRVCGTHGIIV